MSDMRRPRASAWNVGHNICDTGDKWLVIGLRPRRRRAPAPDLKVLRQHLDEVVDVRRRQEDLEPLPLPGLLDAHEEAVAATAIPPPGVSVRVRLNSSVLMAVSRRG